MRPCKPRCIAGLPPFSRYIPQEGTAEGECRIGLDMLEALRLVDAEGLPQEEAAASMNISTATLCRILSDARRQVAVALSQGHNIIIEGGNIMFHENTAQQRRGHGPHGHMGRKQHAACGGRGHGNACQGTGSAAGEQGQGHGMGRGQGRGKGRMGMGQCSGNGPCRQGQAADREQEHDASDAQA